MKNYTKEQLKVRIETINILLQHTKEEKEIQHLTNELSKAHLEINRRNEQ